MIGSYHNIFRLGVALQDLGFWIQNDVIWRKVNPMPNFRGKRFTNAHETLIWAARYERARATFNYESLKALNDDLQMRSDWLFPICSGPQRLKDAAGFKPHPTQKPEALLQRVLLASSKPGDIVLILSSATGTPGARRQEASAAASIRHRADSTMPKPPRSASRGCSRCRCRRWRRYRSKRAEPRVPFGTIVEMRLVEPGATLLDAPKRIRAEVKADGSLTWGGNQGSIHRLGAIAQGKSACNGWTYWHFEADGKLKPIDLLRDEAKRQLGLTGQPSVIAAE